MSLSKAELTSKIEIEAMQPDEFARTRKKGKGTMTTKSPKSIDA
jgi:hypothetical protein